MGHTGRAVLSVFALMLMVLHGLGAKQNRPITVEDCVRTRRILLADDLSSPVQLSPDGTRVAYVVKAPNVVTNRNDYQLYIRDLKETVRREDGRRLLQADRISSIKWLGLSHVVARVERKAANDVESEADIVDANTGVVDKLEFPVKMEEFSISADGKVVVFSSLLATGTPTASQMEEQRVREERGYPIGFGKGTGTAVNNPSGYEIYLGKKTETGKIEATKLYFTGPGDVPRRTILRDVQRLSLSLDGKYLLLNYATETLPEGWENQPLIKELRGFGSPASSEILALYDVAGGQLRLAFNYPGELLNTSWADDSRAYSVISAAPFDTNEGRREAEAAVAFGRVFYYLYRFTHLFAVNAKSGVVTKVVNRDSGRPGYWEFQDDGPLSWKRSDGEMIVRVSDKTFAQMKMSDGTWKEVSRFQIPQDNMFRSMFSSDGRVLVGVLQAVTIPPELFVQDVTTGQTALLTDLNPEYRSITLGEVEKIEWTNRYGSKCSGKLLKPVGHVPGKRYPLVLMGSDFDDDFFISDSLYRTAFAPQSLANAGFAVLMAKYPRDDAFPTGDFPGDMGQAYNWMDMMESAIDLLSERGIVDRNNVGIVGFSRTS